MIGPMSDDKSFIDVPCESREVVRIECNHLECGRRPAHIKPESIARRYRTISKLLSNYFFATYCGARKISIIILILIHR